MGLDEATIVQDIFYDFVLIMERYQRRPHLRDLKRQFNPRNVHILTIWNKYTFKMFTNGIVTCVVDNEEEFFIF